MGRWPHWMQGLAVAVLLLLFGLLVFLFTRPTPGSEVTVVPTPTAVVVILPTATPLPPTPTPAVVVVTATPVPRTATPVVVVVTATPAPAAPPPAPPPPAKKPGPSAEVRAYLDAAQPKLQRVAEVLRSFSEQANRLVSDPALLGDQAWQSRMNAVLATMRATGAELQAPGPAPEVAAPLDATLKSIGRDLAALADEYAAGMEAGSVPRINAAVERSEAIGPKFEQAEEQLDALARGG